jgi:hypothetical protein
MFQAIILYALLAMVEQGAIHIPLEMLNGAEVWVVQGALRPQEEVHNMEVQEEVAGDLYIPVALVQILQVMVEEFLNILPVVVALLVVQELLELQVRRV